MEDASTVGNNLNTDPGAPYDTFRTGAGIWRVRSKLPPRNGIFSPAWFAPSCVPAFIRRVPRAALCARCSGGHEKQVHPEPSATHYSYSQPRVPAWVLHVGNARGLLLRLVPCHPQTSEALVMTRRLGSCGIWDEWAKALLRGASGGVLGETKAPDG